MNVALDVLDREFEDCRDPKFREQMRRNGLPTYRLVRYADDFVVMVRGTRAQAEAIMAMLPGILAPIGLTLSAAKSQLTHIDNGFEFLGFRIVRKPRPNKQPWVYTFVSNESLFSVKKKVKALTSRSGTNQPLAGLIAKLNPIVRGRTAYFRYSSASQTFSYLEHYVWWRVARWLRKKHKGRSWKWLWRRYRLGVRPQDARAILYSPSKMRIVRYLRRGSKIATPWDEVESEAPAVRQMSFDETDFLEELQESLVG